MPGANVGSDVRLQAAVKYVACQSQSLVSCFLVNERMTASIRAITRDDVAGVSYEITEAKVDKNSKPILDKDGKPILVTADQGPSTSSISDR